MKAILNSTAAKDHVNFLGPEGDTLLHLACLYAHEECAQLLLANGADVTVVDEDCSTVLHDAAAGGCGTAPCSSSMRYASSIPPASYILKPMAWQLTLFSQLST